MTSDEKFFEDCRELFMTQGWLTFQEEIDACIESLRLDSISSVEEFWQAKGALAAYRRVLGWEAAVRAAEDSYENSI